MKRTITLMLVLLSMLLVGCTGPMLTPQQQQQQIDQGKLIVDSLKEVTTGLKEVKAQAIQTAATQPAAQPVADKIGQAVDKAVPVVDKTVQLAEIFTQALTNQQAANASTLDKLVVISQATSQTAHAAAPNTPADNYAALAAVLILGVSKIVSSFNNKSNLNTAITTPGTTLEPTK